MEFHKFFGKFFEKCIVELSIEVISLWKYVCWVFHHDIVFSGVRRSLHNHNHMKIDGKIKLKNTDNALFEIFLLFLFHACLNFCVNPFKIRNSDCFEHNWVMLVQLTIDIFFNRLLL